ncbi:hypothetical protein [Senegalia massiliensis]|uniref:Flagellar hook-length control protein FliK n=1 Tax=Senegalia massiliensis TaxID=1720316 RepID=A0A845R060_9CLOT|nr:hypothetical protein [Senegalia massiliensis]NBI06838.1 hypothetical protein [Senegalia massiliensis]
MKISELYSVVNQTINNLNKDMLIKNAIINAKLVEKLDNSLILKLANGELIKAKTEIPVDVKAGENMNFIVKEKVGETTYLKPILNNDEKNSDSLIDKILNEYNLSKNNNNITLVKGIINLDMNISKETIRHISKNINSLEILSKNTKENSFNESLNIVDINDISKQDLVSLINGNVKLSNNEKYILKSFFHDNQMENNKLNIKENTIKSILFLIKNNMDLNIKNLKLTMDIIEGKNFLSNNIIEIKNTIKDYPEFKNIDKRIEDILNIEQKFKIDKFNNIIKKDIDQNVDRNIIKDYYNEISKVIKELSTKAKENENLTNKINDMNEELKFLKEINKNMTLLYMPINIKNKDILDKIYMFNKNKGKLNKDKIKIYLSLNTVYLEKLDIIYEVANGKNIINFNCNNKEVADYINENKNILDTYLDSIKIKNKIIKVNIQKKEVHFEPLEDLDFNNYIFDARV